MLIHLMQHGTCLPKEIDSHQSLSPVGREQIEKSAIAASRLGLRFELMVSSSKPRALQTAEIMAAHTGYPVIRIEMSDACKAMTPPQRLVEFLREYEGLDSVFVAGHQPSLGLVASTLLTGTAKLEVHIENGGLMQINYDVQTGKGVLNWYLTPAQLALIAKD
ncbi:histidine phosphatase family protein [Pseudodesulfovibrio cashew]|uniref:Histidine phosphatase family protein n=1 Tax=Pseudodesulfovibrio cashew TaxID=2678688 RepID=A0A6I6JLX7_9BACT|nr:histidine phosphatase family protein [Pseudodesulfovibrio cashew]QGY41302.1 histidine phosphatase family protein [Pseudodesulfovibrio cashew]